MLLIRLYSSTNVFPNEYKPLNTTYDKEIRLLARRGKGRRGRLRLKPLPRLPSDLTFLCRLPLVERILWLLS